MKSISSAGYGGDTMEELERRALGDAGYDVILIIINAYDNYFLHHDQAAGSK